MRRVLKRVVQSHSVRNTVKRGVALIAHISWHSIQREYNAGKHVGRIFD